MSPMTRTTGQAIVDSLLAHDVDTIFAIPGVQTYPLFDALKDSGIEVITARHEQACAYMALGYAQSTGKPGVFSVVPGPGMLNASAAMLTALGTSTPIVGITGEIPSDYVGRGMGHLHEMADQLATARGFTKWAAPIQHPAHAGEVVADAFAAAQSGRPGPVLVASPWDVLARTASVPSPIVRTVSSPPPDEQSLARAAEALLGATKPLIMVGSGARKATEPILRLAEKLQAPVVSYRGGRGIVSSDHPLGFSCVEGYSWWADADVLLAVGSRQELVWFRWPERSSKPVVINIDIDPQQQVRLHPDIAVTADAFEAMTAIEKLTAHASARPARSEELARVRADVAQRVSSLQPHVSYLEAIREALPADGFFVEEICQIGFTSQFAFPVYEPRHFITSGSQGTLGFGYPTSLGVKAANPDAAVVSVNGDGGFGFGLAELATAVQHHLGVVAVVFDNEAYGNVQADQLRIYGRGSGSTLRNPDWVGLARSFGATGYRVDDPDALYESVQQAISADRPAVIHVPMPLDLHTSPWPFVMPAAHR